MLCADASSEEVGEEISTASRALSQGLTRKNGNNPGPDVICLNKMDLITEERAQELLREYPDAVLISAARPNGVESLKREIYHKIDAGRERMEVLIPHADYAAASRLYGLAEIHAQRSDTEGLWMDVSLPKAAAAEYDHFKTNGPPPPTTA